MLLSGVNPDVIFAARKKIIDKKFPSTPRSVEKQKAIMATKLKRLLETNLRLKADNGILKEDNQKILTNSVNCEKEVRDKKLLCAKAEREVAFKHMQTD